MTASPGRGGHDRGTVFHTERPWKVTVDLPTSTTRWAGRDRQLVEAGLRDRASE